ncbi:unnamed protein product [Prunus brigantina]
MPNVPSAFYTDSWVDYGPSAPYANLRHGVPSDQSSRQFDSDRLPQNSCQNLSERRVDPRGHSHESHIETKYHTGTPSSVQRFSSLSKPSDTQRKKVTSVHDNQHTCKLA